MQNQNDTDKLKVLPPVLKASEFSQSQRTEGYAIWWGDYTTPFFEKQPPSLSDLRRTPVCETAAGESEPLVLGIWGLRDADMVTLEVEKYEFPIDIMAVEFHERVVPPAPTGRANQAIRGHMKILLDTHIFLWFIIGDTRLSESLKDIIC